MEPHIWMWVWFALAAVLAVTEIFTGGYIVLSFAVGAAIAGALELFLPGSINWQWAVFVGISSVMVIASRRLLMRKRDDGDSQDTCARDAR